MFPSCPGSSILINDRSEGSLAVDNYARLWTSNGIRRCRGMSFGNITGRALSAERDRPANNIRHAPQRCLTGNL